MPLPEAQQPTVGGGPAPSGTPGEADGPRLPRGSWAILAAFALFTALLSYAAWSVAILYAGIPGTLLAASVPWGLFVGNTMVWLAVSPRRRLLAVGQWLGTTLLLGGLAAFFAGMAYHVGCGGAGQSPCLAFDGTPVIVLAALAGLFEAAVGWNVLYRWSVAAKRDRLQRFMRAFTGGLDFLWALAEAAPEFAFVGVLIVAGVALIIGFVLGVNALFLFILAVASVILLIGLVSSAFGSVLDELERPASSPLQAAPGPPPPGVPFAPAPMAPVLPPPAPPPVGAAVVPPGFAARFCPQCGSPSILVAYPPARNVHCNRCGRDSAY